MSSLAEVSQGVLGALGFGWLVFGMSLATELQQMSLTPACAALPASSPPWMPVQAFEGRSASGLVCIARSMYTVRTVT